MKNANARRAALARLASLDAENLPALAGKRAAGAVTFGEFSRFAVYPVHTRSDRVTWFVTDAERTDEFGLPSVIRQASTFLGATVGFDLN